MNAKQRKLKKLAIILLAVIAILAISIPAWFLGKSFPVIGGPVFAILIGMVLTLILKEKEPFTAGINYTSKKILQAAVIFLGFGMNLSQILAGGKQSLPIIISTITTSLIIAFILYKALKLKTNNAILVGVGSSICGGSAIAATAPVIDATDEEVAQSISVIFLFNVLAALGYDMSKVYTLEGGFTKWSETYPDQIEK